MASRYDEDVVLWTEQQGRELRAAAGAGWNAPIDWANVAEEIEGLGRSGRHALASHVAIVIEHLLELQAFPAAEPARGWRDSIRRARQRIEDVLEESPRLRRNVADVIARRTPRARALVLANLEDYGEQPKADIGTAAFTKAEVLGDWLPDNDRKRDGRRASEA